MALTSSDKQDIVGDYGKAGTDTGSAEVQVALLTARIKYLTDHMKKHHKDHASRRGLIKLVGHRRNLLRYIRNRSEDDYKQLIGRLGIRR